MEADIHDHPTIGSASAVRITDQVCGMQVPEDAPLRLEQSGQTYRFCSGHCLELLQA
jgi:Cu+-exporting ATPase